MAKKERLIKVGEKILPRLNFKTNQTIVSFISTIDYAQLKKIVKKKVKIVRAIPLPFISLRKGPVPIYPPDKQLKLFFDKIGTTIEIKSEKLSKNFDSTHFLLGNHDLYYKETREVSSMAFARNIERINIISEPTTTNNVAFIPWLVGEEWKTIRDMNTDYTFGHFELPNI